MKKLILTQVCVKYLLLGFLLLLETSLYADNLYVGVQGGWQYLSMETSALVVFPTTPPVTEPLSRSTAHASSGLVDFYAGVQKKVSLRTLIAAEVDVLLPFAKTKRAFLNPYTSTQQLTYNFGGSLKGGLFLTKNGYMYARAGLGIGGFKQTGGKYGLFPDVKGENIFYYRVGAGYNQQFSPHWAAQLEYDYYHYSPFTLNQSTDKVHFSTTLRPSMNVVMGGLSYIF